MVFKKKNPPGLFYWDMDTVSLFLPTHPQLHVSMLYSLLWGQKKEDECQLELAAALQEEWRSNMACSSPSPIAVGATLPLRGEGGALTRHVAAILTAPPPIIAMLLLRV